MLRNSERKQKIQPGDATACLGEETALLAQVHLQTTRWHRRCRCERSLVLNLSLPLSRACTTPDKATEDISTSRSKLNALRYHDEPQLILRIRAPTEVRR